MNIGNVKLDNPYILAPMAGVTDLPFRLLCKEQGAGLLCMEMVSAKALQYNNKNTKALMTIHPKEHPVSLQLFGHEPDVTISDFVADLRAATPSNAAELAVPDQDALRQQLDGLSAMMGNLLDRQIKNGRRQLRMLAQSPSLTSPHQYILQRRKSLELLKGRVFTAQTRALHHHKQKFIAATAKLDAMSPLKVLTRGYSMAQNVNHEVVRSIKQIEAGDPLFVSVSDGVISATVTDIKENGS